MSSSTVFCLSTEDSKSEEVIYKPLSRALSSFVSSHPSSVHICWQEVEFAPCLCLGFPPHVIGLWQTVLIISNEGLLGDEIHILLKFLKSWRKKSGPVSTTLLEASEPWQISHELLSVLTAPTGDCFSLKIYQKNWARISGGGLNCISKGFSLSSVSVLSEGLALNYFWQLQVLISQRVLNMP